MDEKRKKNNISRVTMRKVEDWVKEYHKELCDRRLSLEEIGRMASVKIGETITGNNVRAAFRVMGLEIPQSHGKPGTGAKGGRKDVVFVAGCVLRLYREMGVEPEPGLVEIAEGK